MELLVARDQEHISCDSILDHGLSSDPIVAKGEEDPRHIGLDDTVVYRAKAIEQVHHTLLNQYVDWLFVQCKVHKCQRGELLDLDVTTIVLAELHHQINDASLYQLVEHLLMIGKQAQS